MKAILWRMIYAVVCVLIFFAVVPAFLRVVGFPVSGDVWDLIRICVGCIAVLYVFFGPQPPAPF